MEEQLVEHIHVNVVRNVCKRVVNPSLVISLGTNIEAATSMPSAWYVNCTGEAFTAFLADAPPSGWN
jgi:hypothetical protein